MDQNEEAQNVTIAQVDRRIESHMERLGKSVDKKIGTLEDSFDRKLQKMEDRMDKRQASIDQAMHELIRLQGKTEGYMQNISDKADLMAKKIAPIESDLSDLKASKDLKVSKIDNKKTLTAALLGSTGFFTLVQWLLNQFFGGFPLK
jgi:cell division protein ZapA (FtsZ GTPase activity inhibitor)